MAIQFQHESWSSRLGFTLAAVGGAVGLGNVWKFPYITGTSGGGAFVMVYLLCVICIALPILMAELMLGRRGHQSPPNAMLINAEREGRSRLWGSVGWIGALVGFLILSFYSVIGGWVLDYLVSAVRGFPVLDQDSSSKRLNELLDHPGRMLLWHSVFMALTALIVSRGLHKGIEAVSKIMMPALLIMLVILTVYANIVGDFHAGLDFLFAVDFSKINTQVVLIAVGQAFFSVGISMGLMMAYGAYLGRSISIPRVALVISLADTGVAILAGLCIFPIVFANGLEAGEGAGLIFVTLPLAFISMPGGYLFGMVFFLILLFAALLSSIAILEPVVAWAEEHRNLRRRGATALFAGLAWALGLLSLLSFNIISGIRVPDFVPLFSDKNFFEAIDYLVSNLLMPIGGMLIAVFVGWRMSKSALLEEIGMKDGFLFNAWRWLLRTVVPLLIAALLVLNV